MAEVTRLYVKERLASDKIASLFGVNTSTVIRALRREGVAIRHHNDTKRGAKARNRIDLDPATVATKYRRRGATMRSVSVEIGVSKAVIGRVLREAGEPAKAANAERPTGPDHPSWRHDLTAEEREQRRDMAKQAKWRARVYERDGYTCQCCGDARGGNLHAHHVRDHATNKGERWKVSNGVTLCAPCHRAFHSRHGLTGVDRTMLDSFIQDRRGSPLAA